MTQYTLLNDKLNHTYSSNNSSVNSPIHTPYHTFPYNNVIQHTTTQHKQRNIVILGSSMCGKTCLCVRYTLDRFDDSYEPTMQNTYHKTIYRATGIYNILIRDTQGMSDSESIGSEYGVGYHGYIIVFSVTSRKSYDTAKLIYKKLIQLLGTQSIPILFVGNKTDLVRNVEHSKQNSTTQQKSIQRNEVVQYIRSLNSPYTIPYVECSARSNINIDTVFDEIIDNIDDSYNSTNKQYIQFYMLQPHYIFAYLQSKLMSSVSNLTIHTIEYTCQLSLTMTLLLDVMLLVMAILIDQNDLYIDDSEFAGYLCFAFAVMHLLVCTLGLVGIHRQTIEYLYIYRNVTLIENTLELIVFIWACVTFESIEDSTRQLYTVLSYVTITVVQLLSCLATHIFVSQVQVNQQSDDEYLPMYQGIYT